MHSTPPDSSVSHSTYTNRVLIWTSIVAAVAVVAALLVMGAQVFLLIFGGILLAVVLTRLTRLVEKYTPLPYMWAYAVVTLTLAVAIGGSLWLLGNRIAMQVDQLVMQLQSANQSLVQWLGQYEWGKKVLQQSSWTSATSNWSPWLGVQSVFSSVLGILTSTFVIVFLGLYFAFDPQLYVRGVVQLAPVQRRARARELMLALGETLWKWSLGRLASMTIIGVGASLGLWMLGIPLPLTLGILAALLTFVPNIGGFVAVVPPALLALQQGPYVALYVLIFFAVLQLIESNLLTPIIQQHQVSVPPGLLLSMQLLMGVLTGILGIALATPLAAVLVVITRKLYIEDILEKSPDRANQREEPLVSSPGN